MYIDLYVHTRYIHMHNTCINYENFISLLFGNSLEFFYVLYIFTFLNRIDSLVDCLLFLSEDQF